MPFVSMTRNGPVKFVKCPVFAACSEQQFVNRSFMARHEQVEFVKRVLVFQAVAFFLRDASCPACAASANGYFLMGRRWSIDLSLGLVTCGWKDHIV